VPQRAEIIALPADAGRLKRLRKPAVLQVRQSLLPLCSRGLILLAARLDSTLQARRRHHVHCRSGRGSAPAFSGSSSSHRGVADGGDRERAEIGESTCRPRKLPADRGGGRPSRTGCPARTLIRPWLVAAIRRDGASAGSISPGAAASPRFASPPENHHSSSRIRPSPPLATQQLQAQGLGGAPPTARFCP